MLTGRQTRFLASLGIALLAATTEIRADGSVTPDTITQLLSGTGTEDAVDWDFKCHHGRNCGSWSRLPVPSNWELHGFGRYNYGHDKKKFEERGEYRHRFATPMEWRDRRTWLVFEGVMTDATVRVNGALVGPTHRGAFYAFRYDVSAHLRYGEENLLEVTVDRESSDSSVQRAEREADFWVFGGIFRPVYLESRPPQSIAEVAIATSQDGSLDVRLDLSLDATALPPDRIVARVETLDGIEVGPRFGSLVGGSRAEATATTRLATRLSEVLPWSPETPTLYRLVTELRRGGTVLHRRSDRIGFRTIETREDGLFLNGKRFLLRGINRHSFSPETGRATSQALSRADIELLKWLNANAVRSSHYPPDRHFLDLCDEMGLLVIDELTGWHDAYSTRSGTPLAREMVTFDRNHPSIFAWANGNEGGWNVRLDPIFRLYDLQARPVLHPHSVFGGFDTRHYPTWEELAARLDGSDRSSKGLVLPTEMLHGLYDGGHAAGLEEFWDLLESSPRGAGGFLWALFDEAVHRRDEGDRLDTDGNHAPDGLTGPFRELEASAWGVRQLWAPVRLAAAHRELPASFDGSLVFENHFLFTDLSETQLHWELVQFPMPEDPTGDPRERILDTGLVHPPSVPPGTRGRVPLTVDANPLSLAEASALRVALIDPQGRHRRTWVLPLGSAKVASEESRDPVWVPAIERSDGFELVSDSVTLHLAADGTIAEWIVDGHPLPIQGPYPADWRNDSTHPSPSSSAVRVALSSDNHAVEVASTGPIRHLEWRLDTTGRVDLRYSLAPGLPGLGFELPEESVRKFHRLAQGPFRAWGNRRTGRHLGWWTTPANDTRTGVDWDGYPEMRGYHSDLHWAHIETTFGPLVVDLTSNPSRFLQLLHPSVGPDPRFTAVPIAEPGLSVLHSIPGIGTKFHPAQDLGPPPNSQRSESPEGGHSGRIGLRLANESAPLSPQRKEPAPQN